MVPSNLSLSTNFLFFLLLVISNTIYTIIFLKQNMTRTTKLTLTASLEDFADFARMLMTRAGPPEPLSNFRGATMVLDPRNGILSDNSIFKDFVEGGGARDF